MIWNSEINYNMKTNTCFGHTDEILTYGLVIRQAANVSYHIHEKHDGRKTIPVSIVIAYIVFLARSCPSVKVFMSLLLLKPSLKVTCNYTAVYRKAIVCPLCTYLRIISRRKTRPI